MRPLSKVETDRGVLDSPSHPQDFKLLQGSSKDLKIFHGISQEFMRSLETLIDL